MHMCCNLFIFELKQSLCPSSPHTFPSNVFCFLPEHREVDWGRFSLDGKFWGNVAESCVLCLNTHRELRLILKPFKDVTSVAD